MSKWRIESGQYIGEISALCFLHLPFHLSSLPFLLAGTGSQIILYDLLKGTVIKSFQVFDGIRVHGICCTIIDWTQQPCSFKVVVFGERRVKLFSLHIHSHNQQLSGNLILLNSLPNFRHWVLDVRFLKGCAPSSQDENHCIAIGCSDNSVYFWDIAQSVMNFKVECPDKCLLYSMSIWGDQVEALHIASGTIFNEIIVWKVIRPGKECSNGTTSFEVDLQQYEAFHVCRLSGHEGSIFRIAWSPDGSKLLTASDDRCGRIWSVSTENKVSGVAGEEVLFHSVGPVLFGHTARVWDCCISESLIVTVGEDCTCRVWGLDGIQRKMMKEHIGRGVWRCLYDPNSSLLVTAGFDSSIKVYKLQVSLSLGSVEVAEGLNQKEISLLRIPNSSGHVGLTDSKSEYVRCLQFIRDDTLYVATNKGYLVHAKLLDNGEATWTELLRVSEDAPIICMDLLLSSDPTEDRVVLGDGKGNATAVNIGNDVSGIPKVRQTLVWSAEKERQLLGTFLFESLGYRFVFTADPRGTVKLWKLCNRMQYNPATERGDATLLAEFVSCFGIRIMCLDASFEEEVLVCGDLRGNLVIFPLSKGLFLDSSTSKIKPLSYFKGGHGISSVCSVSIATFTSNQVEIHSTGGDGCICYLEYDIHQQRLEFIGMKQVKEVSLIRSTLCGKYAIGFASADFIVWNLISETKVVQIPCGGWRRPHSYFLGDVPERMNCFAFVKEDIIYIHRNWVAASESKIYPQNLHLQFHGRETHSLCFVSEDSESRWVATGCEDGTVRFTSYDAAAKDWSASTLLGEHVGGSAVRSICLVKQKTAAANPSLLISVGAKRVLTAWQQKLGGQMSFRWLSTDMPLRNCSTREKDKKFLKTANKSESCESDNASSRNCSGDEYENDWRYLDVTAFLVRVADTRISVCFIVVACSDATVSLRALVLPYRLWFDVAFFDPLASPVLALQHVIIPDHQISDDDCRTESSYIVISGSTDGSIAFWDLTESVTIFTQRVSKLESSDFYVDCQKRPRTGRGSQGGRWWKSLSSSSAPKVSSEDEPTLSDSCQDEAKNLDDSPLEIRPCYTLNNIHKSGVNCLHVSDIKASADSIFQFRLISGGDDQALHSLMINFSHCHHKYQIVALYHDNISSAHSSAIKGVWTDGEWVFSTGLDQRVRCWSLEAHGKLSERAHLIVSVPEPEALDARACTRNHYQIAVAGRGMQMVDFFPSEEL